MGSGNPGTPYRRHEPRQVHSDPAPGVGRCGDHGWDPAFGIDWPGAWAVTARIPSATRHASSASGPGHAAVVGAHFRQGTRAGRTGGERWVALARAHPHPRPFSASRIGAAGRWDLAHGRPGQRGDRARSRAPVEYAILLIPQRPHMISNTMGASRWDALGSRALLCITVRSQRASPGSRAAP